MEILVAHCLFGSLLAALSIVDWRTYRLPDGLNAALGVSGLAVAAMMAPGELWHRVIGMVVGYAALAALAHAYRRQRGRDGLGGGDAKLLAGIGAWVSWSGLPTVVLVAALAGLALAAIRRSDRIPFGPPLALGGWLVWIYGPL